MTIKKTHRAQYIIFIQAVLALVWSLYYQFLWDPIANFAAGNLFPIGGGFVPCVLCWWARILMYPIVWVSFISILRKDKDIVHYIFPISIAGIILEVYHYLLQKTSWLDSIWGWSFCTRLNPCNASQSVDYFWFITIPFLCLIAFIVIFVACLIIKRSIKKPIELHHTQLP